MSSLCQDIIDDVGSSLGLQDLSRSPWYFLAGHTGPNAVLKVVVPPARAVPGYVLTVARHANTSVIAHEVNTLNRLKQSLPEEVCACVPTVLVHSRLARAEYFGTPFYESFGNNRIARRLTRRRRLRWVEEWLTQLAASTRHGALTREWVQGEYAETMLRVQRDPRVAGEVKRQVRQSFAAVCNRAHEIPSICCHGDFWSGNILWQRGSRSGVVLDWGAARWPGLPCVDLCRFALGNPASDKVVAASVIRYCRALDVDPVLVAPLCDVYDLFVKAELDVAYATQPYAKVDPFLSGLRSWKLPQR